MTPSGEGKKPQRVEFERNLNYFIFSSCCSITREKLLPGHSAENLPDNQISLNFYFCKAQPSHRKAFLKLPPVALLERGIMETWTLPSKGHSLGQSSYTKVTLMVFYNLVLTFFPHSLCLATEESTWKEQCNKVQFNLLFFSNTFNRYLLSAHQVPTTVLGHGPTITDFFLQVGIKANEQMIKQWVYKVLQQRKAQNALEKQRRLARDKAIQSQGLRHTSQNSGSQTCEHRIIWRAC